jgi:mannose/fructose/N-acetylgalactosamine-specific phosphotransferase system component IIB
MTLVGVRVDHRLIHAQVLQVLIPKLRASTIVVCQDQTNDLLKNILRLSLPLGVQAEFCHLGRVKEIIRNSNRKGKRVLVLFPSVREAYRAYCDGFRFNRLNLGNTPKGPRKRRVTDSLFLTKVDDHAIQRLIQAGVSITHGLNSSPARPKKRGDAA